MSEPSEQISYYTSLCEQLYNTKSPEERNRAQALLEQAFPLFTDSNSLYSANQQHSFSVNTPTETVSALRVLLENSLSPFTQVFSLTRLKQLIQAHFTLFDIESKAQLRLFLLEYAFSHSDLPPFTISQLATVLTTITLMGWDDVEIYRNIHADISQFITSTVDHRIMGMQILTIMVQDINPPKFSKNALKFRKTAGRFRDTQLLEIFMTGLESLDGLMRHTIHYSDVGQEKRLKEATLDLLIKCLSYDFDGTSVDETAEVIRATQVPVTWRPVFEKANFLQALFDAYREFNPPHSAKAMECIVLIASVRKTVFSNGGQRSKFILDTMSGIRDIIIDSQGLGDSDNYNEFCRLLYRFRATVPLDEMVNLPGYMGWMELIAGFSLKAFQSWKFAPNTAMYVLGFWSCVVQTMAYYKNLDDEAVLKLKNIITEITQSYISNIMESVSIYINEGLDDPLGNEDLAIETLEILSQVAHCSYRKSASILTDIFNSITVQYQSLISQSETIMVDTDSFKKALEVIETKLSWLVYITGSFVGNRLLYLDNEKFDHIDSDITVKVLQLIKVQHIFQQQYSDIFSNQKLEMAYIYFFQQFKKGYINESSGNNVYSELNKTFGIDNQAPMLNFIAQKIIKNIQFWANNGPLIRRTLDLFSELSDTPSIATKLITTDSIQTILRSHFDRNIAFLQLPNQDENRIMYFQILSKLFFSQDNINEYMFREFMKPFDSRFISLGELNTDETFQQEFIRSELRDIFVDLHGFMLSIENNHQFILFFDWFYAQYSPILEYAIENWAPGTVAIHLLEFYSEFSHNKTRRLNFEFSSANGILIFKTASQILNSYGRRIVFQEFISEEEKYEYKYKGIISCFSIMCRCLGGKYIGFGTLWLYQDKSINYAINVIIQLIQSIPIYDLMSYIKMAEKCLQMVEELTKEQLMCLPFLSWEAFVNLVTICENGISSTGGLVRAHACGAIFNICQFIINETKKVEKGSRSNINHFNNKISSRSLVPETHWLIKYFKEYPEPFQSLLSTIFSFILFDDDSDQWTLARPLYGLLTLQQEYTIKFIDTIIGQQILEKREFISNALNKLLVGVKWNNTPKDREWFTQNVSAFKKEISLNGITLVSLKP